MQRRGITETVLRAVLTVLGYLLYWDMLNDRELLIFSDGARNIKNVIEDVFSFRPYSLNLDWYHLKKHCYEVFTMALKGGAAKDILSAREKGSVFMQCGNSLTWSIPVIRVKRAMT